MLFLEPLQWRKNVKLSGSLINTSATIQAHHTASDNLRLQVGRRSDSSGKFRGSAHRRIWSTRLFGSLFCMGSHSRSSPRRTSSCARSQRMNGAPDRSCGETDGRTGKIRENSQIVLERAPSLRLSCRLHASSGGKHPRENMDGLRAPRTCQHT